MMGRILLPEPPKEHAFVNEDVFAMASGETHCRWCNLQIRRTSAKNVKWRHGACHYDGWIGGAWESTKIPACAEVPRAKVVCSHCGEDRTERWARTSFYTVYDDHADPFQCVDYLRSVIAALRIEIGRHLVGFDPERD